MNGMDINSGPSGYVPVSQLLGNRRRVLTLRAETKGQLMDVGEQH
jgi:hypothetical protein